MDYYQNPYMTLSGMSAEELGFLKQVTTGLDETQQKSFFTVYATKRKNPQEVLLLTLPGFVGFSGIHRLVLGQIGMGLLYFFTGGLCLIGTIVDLINHKSLAFEYNQKMAYESFNIVKMGVSFY